ncbi:uncharacterized protein LOC114481484 [Gouania willdenowi]|uniref:uncharacterized protein LOC114481484 n=1 Tax=Gouania willdenowi TaxID=441366 RepID=UPI001056357E|nr:uncharacterized protein LOC114481484 [Gouania willdenowi]
MDVLLRNLRPAELNVTLVSSLSSFVKLYDRSKGALLLAVQRLESSSRDSQPCSEGAGLLSMLAGAIGAVVGALAGGAFGALGGIAAATYTRLFRHVNAVGASLGLFGGVLGGVVGGVFSGVVGCAVEVAAAGSGRPINGMVSRVLFFTLGCSTAGALGSIFGGSVGAAGGAIGGGFGALCARISAVYIAAGTMDYSPRSRNSEPQVEVATMEELSATIRALKREVETLQRICGEMETKGMRKVALQTKKTLRAASAMEQTLMDCQSSASFWRGGVKECRAMLKELEKMKTVSEETLRLNFKVQQKKNFNRFSHQQL